MEKGVVTARVDSVFRYLGESGNLVERIPKTRTSTFVLWLSASCALQTVTSPIRTSTRILGKERSMFAALYILFFFLAPSLMALGAIGLSISALRRHATRQQFVFAAFVIVAGIASVSSLYQGICAGQSISFLSIALISFSFLFSMYQLAAAIILEAVGRLRQRMA